MAEMRLSGHLKNVEEVIAGGILRGFLRCSYDFLSHLAFPKEGEAKQFFDWKGVHKI